MTKEEMKKKRDQLATEKMEPYLPDFKPIVGAMVCVGWDACAKEYEILLRANEISTQDIMDKTQEAAHYNWLDDKNILLEQKLNKAIEALKEAAEYHNIDDVNGEAGYIAWKALKEIKGE